MSAKRVDIVDPTLRDKAGHCYSFIRSFIEGRDAVAPATQIVVYADRRAHGLFDNSGNVTLHRHFSRRLRKLQTPLLYRRLLRAGGNVFIPTATRVDLTSLAAMAYKHIADGNVTAYVHWFRDTEARRKQLRWIARKAPGIKILTPCSSVLDLFGECGFASCELVPYPVSMAEPLQPQKNAEFEKVIYAGAARRDKGFHSIVSWITSHRDELVDTPVTIQASPPHSGKRSREIEADLQKLRQARCANLTILDETLSEDEYARLFQGAICLQLYAPDKFSDRVSGVTLDALTRGAPVIAIEGTWTARIIADRGAGIVIDSPVSEAITEAVKNIQSDYRAFAARAVATGSEIRRTHDPRKLFEAVVTR